MPELVNRWPNFLIDNAVLQLHITFFDLDVLYSLNMHKFALLQLNALHLQEIPGEESVGELKQLTKEELKQVDIKELQYKVSLLEDKLRSSHPNLGAIKEYKHKVITCVISYNQLYL
jgi:hypothetical protein